MATAMACGELGWLWSRLGAGPEERGAREMTMMPTRTGAAKLSPSAPLNLVVSAAAPMTGRSRSLVFVSPRCFLSSVLSLAIPCCFHHRLAIRSLANKSKRTT